MLRGSVGASKTLSPQSPSPPPSLRAHNQFTPLLGLAAMEENRFRKRNWLPTTNASGYWLEVTGQQPPSVELPLSPSALLPSALPHVQQGLEMTEPAAWADWRQGPGFEVRGKVGEAACEAESKERFRTGSSQSQNPNFFNI